LLSPFLLLLLLAIRELFIWSGTSAKALEKGSSEAKRRRRKSTRQQQQRLFGFFFLSLRKTLPHNQRKRILSLIVDR
jgi:hypothetical protein